MNGIDFLVATLITYFLSFSEGRDWYLRYLITEFVSAVTVAPVEALSAGRESATFTPSRFSAICERTRE